MRGQGASRAAGSGAGRLGLASDPLRNADPDRPPVARGRWLLLALLIAAAMINYCDRQIIAVLKPVIEQDLGWTDADYGRLASLFQLAAAGGFVFAGWIVDRVGPRWANPLGVLAWSIAAMAHGWARSLLQFALARIALGASESTGTPAAIKTVASVFPPGERSLAIGVSNGATNLGAIVAPLFLPSIAAAFGWRMSFVAVGALGLAWVAVWWLAVVSGRVEVPTHPPRGLSDAPPLRYRTLLRERRTWGIAGAKALSDQVWWLMLFWAPDFFHRVFHLGLTQLGPPLAVVYGCAAIGSLLGGWVPLRLLKRGFSINTVRKGVLLGCAILVTPVPLALYAHNYWLAVALLGLTLAAHQAFSVNIFALIADITPPGVVGSVTSIGALCGNLAGMVVLFGAGVLLSHGYGYLPLLLLASVSYLLAVGWLQLWLPRLRPVAVEAR